MLERALLRGAVIIVEHVREPNVDGARQQQVEQLAQAQLALHDHVRVVQVIGHTLKALRLPLAAGARFDLWHLNMLVGLQVTVSVALLIVAAIEEL